ncbi:MurR/RpiR family transcriptional regulator [Litoreibacter albidus]|uniref:Transcriptional regulator, RpiR family n=1 Tax=Litoreibacter albidus TaxID=670155 RepID=A0A1H3CKI3_9RHOB|nr:MurR/RpiR family transcriptional regulator [Litoreibacter albidus]SDX54615.1 transcriptional regulator, RpiR family [Litoreibacter albidus]
MDAKTSSFDDNLLETIVRLRDTLRKSDSRVAEVVLEKPEDVVSMTLAQLANAAEVSEPTVIRFCAAVGCDGFRDLRVKLARSMAFARSTSHTAITEDDDLGAVMTKIFDYNLSNLNWAQSKLDERAVCAAVDVLAGARRIEFFGFGASGIVARDAQQKFPLFAAPCGAPADAHQMYMTAEMLGAGDVAVGISNTGHTHEIVTALEVARSNGAATIGITGQHGPMLDHCDVALVVETLENTDLYTPTVSRLSHLVVIDILSTAVSLRRDESHHQRITRMKARLTLLRGTISGANVVSDESNS